jgi:hypothetical protein
MGEPSADRELTRPHESRLSPSHPDYHAIVSAHAAALTRGEETYVDPATGLTVWTAGYLLARGSCCHTGCRHCPYVG